MVARQRGDRSPTRTLKLQTTDGEVEELVISAAALVRLRQAMADFKETRRFVIVRRVIPGYLMYYNVSDHGFVLNNPAAGTLFLKRDAAEAVAALLHPGVRVLRCRTRVVKGVRVPIVRGKTRSPKTGLGEPRRRTSRQRHGRPTVLLT